VLNEQNKFYSSLYSNKETEDNLNVHLVDKFFPDDAEIPKLYENEFITNLLMFFENILQNSTGRPSVPGDFPFCIDLIALTHSSSDIRLKNNLIKIINKSQSSFIKGRYIGDNIRSLLEVIDLTEEENLSCIVLSIDFEKAFDTISWKFKKKCLSFFNFGESRLIKFVYRLHIETVLSLFFYSKTLLYLLIALWLFLEFLHIKEINKEKSDMTVVKNRSAIH
jgi:hypothetical protein